MCCKRCLAPTLLVFAVVLSVVVIKPAYSTTATGPGGTIIEVDQGEVFLLRHSVTFDQPSETGYFLIVIGWYDNGSKEENFTLENAPSVFWQDGSPVENVYCDNHKIPSGWQVEVGDNDSGIAGDGTFYVDVWLRAASGDGTPHRPMDNHPIYYAMDTILLCEPDPVIITAKPITIRVRELSAIIYPSDDADVYERYPDNNYGSDTSIWVCPYDNRKNRGFLKFSLNEIPSGATIQQAKLHLNCWKKEYDNFDAACCEVENDSWSENTITWNNQPSYGSSLDVVEVIGVGWYTWDVKSFVSQEFGGDNIVSFCLKGAVEPHSGRALFDSKEWYNNHPYLEIKYTLSKGSSSSKTLEQEIKDFSFSGGSISFSISFEEPFIKTAEGYDLIEIPGCGLTSLLPGAPIVPKKTVSVLLPPENSICSIDVTQVGSTPVKKEVYLYPGQRPVQVSDNSEHRFTPPDHEIYGSSGPYPTEKLSRLDFVTSYRGYMIAVLTIFPITYVPVERKAIFHPRLEVEIMLGKAAETLAFRPTTDVDEWVKGSVINPELMSLYRPYRPLSDGSSNGVEYLIITRNMFLDNLKKFISWKENKGLGVAVEVVENIENKYENLGRDIPERIWNCIKDYYENKNNSLQWVLLAGDADSDDGPPPVEGGVPNYELDKPWEVPTRYVWNPEPDDDCGYTGLHGSYRPTDYYYAGLDNTWDWDNDNLFGEFIENAIDNENVDEADWFAEVYVGRFSARDDNTMQAIVAKTVAYEQDPPRGFRDICLFGADLTICSYEDGKTLKRHIRDNYIAPVDTHEYYQKDVTLSKSAFIDAIENYDPILINAASHGSTTACLYRYALGEPQQAFIDRSTTDNIKNRGFLLFAMACFTNAFDVSNDPCLGEAMLRDNDGGAVGYIGGTRFTWMYFAEEPPQYFLTGLYPGLDRLFFEQIFENEEYCQGAALHKSKVEYATKKPGVYGLDRASERNTLFVPVLLGDPELSIIKPLQPFYNVSMSISPSHMNGVQGDRLTYTVTVWNTGNVRDIYDLSLADDAQWGLSISPATLTLDANKSGTAILNVRIPQGTSAGTVNRIRVAAVSRENTEVNTVNTCAGYAGLKKVYPSDDVTVSEDKVITGNYEKLAIGFGEAEPGKPGRAWLKFFLDKIPPCTLILSTKLFLYFDWYALFGGAPNGIGAHFSDNDSWSENTLTWSNQPSFDNTPTDNIAQFSDLHIWKNWNVTPDVVAGFKNDKKVTWCLKAGIEPNEELAKLNSARSKEYFDEDNNYLPYLEVAYIRLVSISPSQNSGLPGTTLNYGVTITNTSENEDNYILTAVDDKGWSLSLSENMLENIKPSENRMITLSVVIPENTAPYTEDFITVAARLKSNDIVSDSDNCIAYTFLPRAELNLATLYKVSLDIDLFPENGSKLIVKFYKYDNIYQTESTFWSGAPPEQITRFDNVPHPRAAENYPWGTLQRATLVLTTDNAENVVSIITSFTVRQSHLKSRFKAILKAWFPQPELHDAFRAEVKDILGQWFPAPP